MRKKNSKVKIGLFITIGVVILLLIGYEINNNNNNTSSESEANIANVDVDIEISEEPKRIVDLSGNSDILSILGYKVVGTVNSDSMDYSKLPYYLEEELKGAKLINYSIEDTNGINSIKELNPDLIIISTLQSDIYEELSEIAPTVKVELEGLPWKQDVMAFAKLLNKEEEGNDWLASYDAKAKEVGRKIKEEYGKNTSFLSLIVTGDQFSLLDGAGIGSILYEDLALAKPKGIPEKNNTNMPFISYEGIASIKADYIFLIATDEEIKQLKSNILWKSLNLVKNRKVIALDKNEYINKSYSAIGRKILIDEIYEILIK